MKLAEERRIAGVMGGMGPEATVDFMAKVVAMTNAADDQGHVHMIVDQDPTVPNRQGAIAGDEVAAAAITRHLGQMSARLETAGADFLVLVCNTAHVFLDDVRARATIPFISIIDESIAEVDRICPDAKCLGVMATEGCLDTGVYQHAVESSGRNVVIPDRTGKKRLMAAINAVKSGDKGAAVAEAMRAVAQTLVDEGAELIIGGCTEIPIVFDGSGFCVPVISSTDVLARKTVDLATGVESAR